MTHSVGNGILISEKTILWEVKERRKLELHFCWN